MAAFVARLEQLLGEGALWCVEWVMLCGELVDEVH